MAILVEDLCLVAGTWTRRGLSPGVIPPVITTAIVSNVQIIPFTIGPT